MTALAIVAVFSGSMAAIRTAPASAYVDDYESVSVPSSWNSNSPRSITAFCPNGKELIGFGGSADGGFGNVFLYAIVPNLTDDSVVVSAREVTGGTVIDWSVRAVAVCADAGEISGTYVVEEEEDDIVGWSGRTAYADCDAGDYALAGGFELSGASGELHLIAVQPTTDTVMVSAEEDANGAVPRWDVTAIALCAPLSSSQVYRSSVTSTATSGSTSKTPSCPNGFNVSGGGGFVDDLSGSSGHVLLGTMTPSTYQGTGLMWVSSLKSYPATATDSILYAYVTCLDTD